MIQLPPDLKDFLRLLNANSVQYLLIGGYAVAFHGYPRATGDMDVWIAVDSDNASRIVKSIREFGFDVPNLTADLFLKRDNITRMGNEPMQIEVFTTIPGVIFQDCYKSAVIWDYESLKIPVISLSDLKKNKLASARAKDLGDIENLP